MIWQKNRGDKVKLKELRHYPILHRFLTKIYIELDIFETEDMLKMIENDQVRSYCKCTDKECSSFFMNSDRELDLSEDDGIYYYNTDKGFIMLEFFANGNIDVQALSYAHYPFRDELISVYNDKEYPLKDDLEAIENMINEYFSEKPKMINTIIVD